MKKLNKKGFTLAELLIVVAIIAILAAIAVPLFVGAMNDAEKAVGEGNVRAVKGLAVAYILSNQDDMHLTDGTVTEWYAYGEVSPNGDVSNLKVQAGGINKLSAMSTTGDSTVKTVTGADGSTVIGWWQKNPDVKGGYKVLVKIADKSEITDVTSSS